MRGGGGNDPLIASLRAAVAAAPADHALRSHLALVLNDAGQPADALEQATMVLAHAPEDPAALEQATRAKVLLGRSPEATAPVVQLHALTTSEATSGSGVRDEEGGVRLDDVAGLDEVKRRLRLSFLGPLQNPALRRMYGKSLRGGLLLWGPPGCGKTFIARATAGELGARFLSVGLHDVLDMYLGESERNLHELFENARRMAPCVLFFDEVDALGRRRSNLRHSAGRDVVVQFLSELDSFGSENEGVYVLSATNHPWDVDPALRRPGRFDRTLLVLPPDEPARVGILAAGLRGRPLADGLDLDGLARRTNRFSGADLTHLCETAAEHALEDSIISGTPRPIAQADLERALEELQPSTTAWLDTARNYAQFSNEGGAYDDLLTYLRAEGLL